MKRGSLLAGYLGGDLSWDMSGFLEPLIDVNEHGDEIIITSDLPCVEKEDIDIYATRNTLEINAKMKKEYCFKRWGTLQKRISFSSFRKVIELPSIVDVKNIKSRFIRGILEIRLPKKSRMMKIHIE